MLPGSRRSTPRRGRRLASMPPRRSTSSPSRRTRVRSPSTGTGRAVPRRLYRSRDERMLFGVAGGMARYVDIDPSIVRIIWALLVLAGGAGLLLYIVAAIVIPE